MRTHTRTLRFAASLLLLAGISLTGCVDEQETLPAGTTAGVKVHPDGWSQPGSAEFHGQAIRASNWNMNSCKTCHGNLYNGGTSQKSCLTCHNQAAGPEDCATCHGSAINPAPPQDTEGNTAASNRGVGAHQAHLVADEAKVLKCAECHSVPTALMSIGHIDTTQFAEVAMNDTLANLITGGGAFDPNPVYNATTLGCSSTYCHGTFRNGNGTNVAVWTDPSTGVCGTCHGDDTKSTRKEKALPKTTALGGTHPPGTDCQVCHTNVDANAVFTNAAVHVNGIVNLKDLSGNCSACHGSTTNAAPPVDLAGNSAVTAKGVGAHQAHLVGSGDAQLVACTECHTVPATVDVTGADGHMDASAGAEVLFNGSLATHPTGSITPSPSYNSTGATCSNTYCHGNFVNGNPTTAPVWNAAAGTGAQCGTCHGDATRTTVAEKALPGGTHPAYTSCVWCHSNIDATASFTNGATHVNGSINLASLNAPADCARCHGTGSDPAPPVDLAGNTVVTAKGVGAHQAHLNASGAKDIACMECHTVPATIDLTGADGHIDANTGAEVAFNGTLAKLAMGGVTPAPAYTSANATCASTYCHGTFKNGNQSNAPVWNSAAGAGAQCGSCHGDVTKTTTAAKALPTGTHPAYTECQWCHTSVTAGPTFTDVDNHVDGTVPLFQVSTAADCSHCHGSVTNAAPPNDLAGNASSGKVGAHQVHLSPSTLTTHAVACNECHTVPATLDYTGADGHLDGTAGAELAFGSFASITTASGAVVPNPSYTGASLSCSSTYCHGTFTNGNLTNAPVWNNPSTAACGTCHGNPATGNPRPPAPHSTSDNCGICHSVSGESPVATYTSADTTWSITNKPYHINGKLSLFTAERDPWP